MKQNTAAEKLIKKHPKWTQWIEKPRLLRLGNLILTNRRLLFLHQVPPSPEITAMKNQEVNFPLETNLNNAFRLNQNNFQIPLSSIGNVRIGAFNWNPMPHVCLTVIYFDGINTASRSASFQFIRPIKQTILKPQIVVVIGWVKAINQAIKNAETPDTK